MRIACAAWFGVACVLLTGCNSSNTADGGMDAARDAIEASADVPPPCPAGQQMCAGTCIDVRVDPGHCGSCGHACMSGEVCSGGACSTSCPSGQMVCGGACVTVASDAMNCGACGSACPSGQSCVSGHCSLVCPSGQTACGMSCRDLSNDNTNCGACGTACPAGQACSTGSCSATCATGLTNCSGSCRDLMTDNLHCGSCSTACGAGMACSAGSCSPTCAAPLTMCTGTCVNMQNDPTNCGSCAHACASTEYCAAGVCTPVGAGACAPPNTVCGGTCTATSFDPANCGSCGNACATPANAAAACGAGRCGFVCNAGFGDCDRAASTGCEVNLNTNVSNCGSCGHGCFTFFANATDNCTAGTCGFTCNTGFANCDAVSSNGCEANLNGDPNHCGTCSTVCPSGQLCVSGVCAPPPYTVSNPPIATVPFIDACAATGSTTILAGADDVANLVMLPFAFTYFGMSIAAGSNVNVSSNGFISMDGVLAATPTTSTLPNSFGPRGVVAAHWADLVQRTGICLATVGAAPNRKWVIETNDAQYYSDPSGHFTFEIVLTETSNTIDFIYSNMADATAVRSVGNGIENTTNSLAIQGCPGGATSCAPASMTVERFTPM